MGAAASSFSDRRCCSPTVSLTNDDTRPKAKTVSYSSNKPVRERPADLYAEKQLLRHYMLKEKLGVGASCEVVKARRLDDDTDCAVKILHKGSDNTTLWKSEAFILSLLQHPNIVSFVESFEDTDSLIIVTDLCEGGELFDRISEGKFSERDASRLVKAMLLALQHCHERNVVHRDLKPENFVFEDPNATAHLRLIDFGCAVKREDDEQIPDRAGSPYYVAPEVIESGYHRTGRIWKAADMWSIGVIIFLLVHGYPPFNGSNQQAIFERIRRGKFRLNKKELSAEVQDLIEKLLVKEPLMRLTVAEALQHPWIATEVAPEKPLADSIVTGIKSFRKACRLKKAVRRLMADQMTETDMQQLASVFEQYDKNGDGKLQPDEIRDMLKSIGEGRSYKKLLKEFDMDKDGLIDLHEFSHMHIEGKLTDEEKLVQEKFKEFDLDGDGEISVQELEKILSISDKAAKKMVKEVDKDGNGQINFNEWLAAMRAEKKK